MRNDRRVYRWVCKGMDFLLDNDFSYSNKEGGPTVDGVNSVRGPSLLVGEVLPKG